MLIRINTSGLKETRWGEYAARFALGGLATVLTGLIAENCGPETGGLFLAFPAIFCASATMIEKHERKRKADQGLRGERRGKSAAALDAVGAACGSVGLGFFALTLWLCAPFSVVGSLTIATVSWLALAILTWRLRRELRTGISTARRTGSSMS